jgi:hypothetical protein
MGTHNAITSLNRLQAIGTAMETATRKARPYESATDKALDTLRHQRGNYTQQCNAEPFSL